MPFSHIFRDRNLDTGCISESAKAMLFPHDKERPIQKAFLMQAYGAISSRQNLIVHAPTGIGKTTVLAPALAHARNKKLTIFFLTSRHTQHKIALETLHKIRSKYGLNFGAIDIIGKKWMCAVKGVETLSSSEFSEYCRDMRDKDRCKFYKNVRTKGKLSKIAKHITNELYNNDPISVEGLVRMCAGAGLCPYEVACAAAQKAEVIIADYNHLLNKNIRDPLLAKMGKCLNRSIVIIDEAHNLPQRARELMTFNLSTATLEMAFREARQINEVMAEDIDAIKGVISELAKRIPIDLQEMLVLKNEFYDSVEKIGGYEELAGNFRFMEDQVLEHRRRSYVGSVANFMEGWLGPEDGFVRIISRGFDRKGKPYAVLSYKCLDPSFAAADLTNRSYCTIAMSGTLTPVEMYRDLFSFEKKRTITVEYGNPFPKRNSLILVVPKTTTRYTVRGKSMYDLISRELLKILESVPGNAAVFFPSYSIRDKIYEIIADKLTKTIFLEQSSLSKVEKEGMIDSFKSYKDTGAVLFGASSGSMGEGIDLPGDLLKAVVVVGLPLAKPDLETQELIKYYERRYGRGWDYGYVFPAIVKTMQNAGRCIRSEKDRGVIVFLDERYAWKNYLKCFPSEWDMRITKTPENEIERFFREHI